MFCYQCEQTAQGTGCTAFGVCGKDPETAALQDLLVHALKGISMYAHRARQLGRTDSDLDTFTVKALFATLTNVNFDPARFEQWLHQAYDHLNKARSLYEQAAQAAGKEPETLTGPAAWTPADNLAALETQGESVGIAQRLQTHSEDVTGLEELVLYGLKGLASYSDHAHILGKTDDTVYAFIHQTLNTLAQEDNTPDNLLPLALRTGEVNLKVMQMLDAAHTETFGHPEPTQVRVTPIKGKAILVSGHDLKDLEELLKQTQDKNINVYTHGEMLPALAYPALKKYPHLAGNYGGAWQDQRKEFDDFPGAILMTTNCIQKPKTTYNDRIFTTGVVGYTGVKHLTDHNFAPLIQTALDAPGFTEDAPEKLITIGFARNTVMSVAPKVIEAVKAGKIKHFFLIGGCDGARPGRNYYTDLAQQVPDDCIILTLACGKYRFNKLDFGDIEGIPRLLDVGQCNDAYSAIQIAVALANAFDCSVNELPLSLVVSWFEQKAVAILLTLLHLGIKNVRLGPSLPAFVTPNVLNVLVDKFDLKPITTPQEDLAAMLA